MLHGHNFRCSFASSSPAFNTNLVNSYPWLLFLPCIAPCLVPGEVFVWLSSEPGWEIELAKSKCHFILSIALFLNCQVTMRPQGAPYQLSTARTGQGGRVQGTRHSYLTKQQLNNTLHVPHSFWYIPDRPCRGSPIISTSWSRKQGTQQLGLISTDLWACASRIKRRERIQVRLMAYLRSHKICRGSGFLSSPRLYITT